LHCVPYNMGFPEY